MKLKLPTRIPTVVILVLIALLPLGVVRVQAAEQWKDAKWPDPGIVLSNVVWEDVTLDEVANVLRDSFKDHFDVLLPSQIQTQPSRTGAAPVIDPATGIPVPHAPVEVINVRSEVFITLRLKNVSATEVFNAMNIMFETQKAPWRWQLVMNGHRPTAVFRILPESLSSDEPAASRKETKKERKVIFVGGLLDFPGSDRVGSYRLAEILFDVYSGAYGQDKPEGLKNLVQFHQTTELLVVTGTPDEVQLIENTLAALQQKVNLDARRKAPQPASGDGAARGEFKTKSEATKSP